MTNEKTTPSQNSSKRKCGECHWHEKNPSGRGIQCWHNPPVIFPSGFADRPPVGAHDPQCASFLAMAEPTREDEMREGAEAVRSAIASGKIQVKAAVNVTEGPRGKRNA